MGSWCRERGARATSAGEGLVGGPAGVRGAGGSWAAGEADWACVGRGGRGLRKGGSGPAGLLAGPNGEKGETGWAEPVSRVGLGCWVGFLGLGPLFFPFLIAISI